MSAAISAFNWKTGERSIFAAAKQCGTAAPASNHPLRKGKALSTGNAFTGTGGQIKPGKPAAVYKTNGMVKPKNGGFDIPSRAQADTDRRHALRKGGI